MEDMNASQLRLEYTSALATHSGVRGLRGGVVATTTSIGLRRHENCHQRLPPMSLHTSRFFVPEVPPGSAQGRSQQDIVTLR